jgi:hypothetical protein
MALGLVRKPHRQFMGNLLGTPPLAQQIGDHTMELLVTRYAARPRRPGLPLDRKPLRRSGQVAALIIRVAAQLPRNR